MAFILFNSGKRPMAVSDPEKALHIWQVLIGEAQPENDQQAEFIAQIDRIYLNRNTAPESYKAMYPEPLDPSMSYASTLGVRK